MFSNEHLESSSTKLNQNVDSKPKGETDLCRNRLLKYCKGQGLDLGCGNVKIKNEAIGIDLLSPYADMRLDARLMPFYNDEFFDYIFSSHLLEEIENTEATLREWLRILKKGGYIVLYQADRDYYYPLDDPRCNQKHIHHFVWKDLWEIFEKIGNVELTHHDRYSKDPYNEWSFELVIQKMGDKKKDLNGDEGISILVPTLNRPENIEKFTYSIDKTTSEPNKVEIVFGIHDDDKISAEKIEEIKSKIKIKIRPVYIKRHGDNKIHLSFLWNQIYEEASFPIVGYFGDDVLFHTEGWDKEVREEFAKDKAVMVCCNDVHIQKGKTATLFFTHKTVHDVFGFYLPMKFRRWYADTYWDVIFRNAGKYHYREDIVTEHLHPDIFQEQKDDVYKAMEVFKAADKQIWHSEENKNELLTHIETLKNFKSVETKKTPLILQHIGSEWGGVNLYIDLIQEKGTVVSAGIGPDASLDLELIREKSCVIQAVDPTDIAKRTIKMTKEKNNIPEDQLELHAYALSDESGKKVVLGGPARTIFSSTGEEATTISIIDLLKPLSNMTLLKLDIEGAEFPVIKQLCMDKTELQRLNPEQICVGFHHWLNGPTDKYPGQDVSFPYSWKDTIESIELLNQAGYKIVHYSNDDPKRAVQEALFVREDLAKELPDKLKEIKSLL